MSIIRSPLGEQLMPADPPDLLKDENEVSYPEPNPRMDTLKQCGLLLQSICNGTMVVILENLWWCTVFRDRVYP